MNNALFKFLKKIGYYPAYRNLAVQRYLDENYGKAEKKKTQSQNAAPTAKEPKVNELGERYSLDTSSDVRYSLRGESGEKGQIRYSDRARDPIDEVRYSSRQPLEKNTKAEFDTSPIFYPKPDEQYSKRIPLEEIIEELDESFSEMLLRKIDESGMKDADCYKKANIDRRLFSKIRSDKDYRPQKRTALAFAIALRLSLDETNELLKKAGYTISHSNKLDVIVEYFIKQGEYDIWKINSALLEYDQQLLGS